MPITDPSLPTRFLRTLETAGVRFVVLHREAEIGTDSLDGDLDIAVEITPDDVVERTQEALKEAGLRPVIRWPYDIGGTIAFFLSTDAGDHGMQADLLHDPRGLGRYGVRSGEILERAIMGKRYPVPDPLDERLYLISKRWRKGQTTALLEEMEELQSLAGLDEAHERAQQLFAPKPAQSIRLLMDGGSPRQSVVPFGLRDLRRRFERAIRPVGYWVEFVGPLPEGRRLTQSLLSRFEGWVVHLNSGGRPSALAGHLWWLNHVMPIKVRPGIFLSYSESRRLPKPDLTIDWSPELTAEQSARSIVAAMSARVTS